MIPIPSRDLLYLNQKPTRGVQLNWEHPLARGLVGCLLMNEARGVSLINAVPCQANRTNSQPYQAGIFEGVVGASGNYWATSKFGWGLTLPGSNQYVYWGDGFPAIASSNVLSISAWLNPASVNVNQAAAAYRSDSSAQITFQLDRNNADMRMLCGASPGTIASSTYSGILVAGQWFHVVGTVKQLVPQVFVNGVAAAVGATGSTPSPRPNVLLVAALQNSGAGPSGYWAGSLDHVMIWNRVLTQAEITWLYQEPFAMFLPLLSRHAGKGAAAALARSQAVIIG